MPLFFNRYVDDTFILCRSSHEAHEIYQILNSIHSSLKLTHENEEEDKLVFLDIDKGTTTVAINLQEENVHRTIHQIRFILS